MLTTSREDEAIKERERERESSHCSLLTTSREDEAIKERARCNKRERDREGERGGYLV